MSTQQQRILKMALCGGNAVGKSSIGARLARQEPDLEHNPTIGVDYFARRLPAYNAKIGIWDLAGDRRFDTITTPYITGTTIILFVYDITRCESVMELRRLHSLYKKVRNLEKVNIIVVGNKMDKGPSAYTTCVDRGKTFAIELSAPHVEISAKTGQGLEELLSVIIRETNLEKVERDLMTDIKIMHNDSIRTCRNCLIS